MSRQRVQRLSDWEDARYSTVPPRASRDNRLSWTHGRLLIELGRVNTKQGWCELSQKALAEVLGIARQTINIAMAELVEWGYVQKKSQQQTGTAFCQYRVTIDDPAKQGDVSATDDTPLAEDVSPTDDTRVRSGVTPVSGASTDTHLDHRSKITPPTPKGGSDVVSAFEEFWQAFPEGRKRGKGGALKAFKCAVAGVAREHKATPGELVAAAKRYAASRPDPRYVPMPTTWLNQARWLDDPSPVRSVGSRPVASVHDTSEPFQAYRARMIAEGKLQPTGVTQ